MGSFQKLNLHKFILIMAKFCLAFFFSPLAVSAKCNLTFAKQSQSVKYSMSKHNKQARSTHTKTRTRHIKELIAKANTKEEFGSHSSGNKTKPKQTQTGWAERGRILGKVHYSSQ